MSKPNGNSIRPTSSVKYFLLGREPESFFARRPRVVLVSVFGFLLLLILYLAFNGQLSSVVSYSDLLEVTRAKVNASRAPQIAGSGTYNDTNSTHSGSSYSSASTDGPKNTNERSTTISRAYSTLTPDISTTGESSTNGLSIASSSIPSAASKTLVTRGTTQTFSYESTPHPSSTTNKAPSSTASSGASTSSKPSTGTPTIMAPFLSSTSGAPPTPTTPSEILQRPVPDVTNTSNVYDAFAIYTNKCRIRDYDFNDTKVLKDYFSGKIAHCKPDAKPFVFYPKMDLKKGFSCVGFDSEISKKHYNATKKDWKCIFKELIRNSEYKDVDRHFDYGKTGNLTPDDCPPYEFLWIECDMKYNEKLSYTQPLLLPLVKPAKKNWRNNNRLKKPLNVLVVGMDSVSRLNAHRQFPKTLKFLQTKKNLIELFGYNKIGLNSAPNQIPLLTGVKYHGNNLQARVTNNYFDNETRYLWDDYESRGYRTMFYEEQWKYGLFVYPSSEGFREVPTTYWPRPVFQATDWSDLKKDGFEWCIGPEFPAKQYLDYTLNTFRMLGSERPLFSYSWLSEIAHNDVNGGIRADGYFLDFFKGMDEYGLLDTTAVFFISDHGFRFGSFRQTELGRYEDMLPYGFILMPDSYFEQYPQALTNLKANSRRLVTVYDLHVTMLELADAWDEDRTVRTPNGFSLLSNIIPEERTCASAGIDFQFCSCFEPQPYDRNGSLAVQVASFVIDAVNGIVLNNNATSKCHVLKLTSINTFTQLSEGSHWTNYFKISLKTEPTAQFEAAVEFNSKNNWTLLSDIDRTDWFSSHAACVKGSNYERYCYCRE